MIRLIRERKQRDAFSYRRQRALNISDSGLAWVMGFLIRCYAKVSVLSSQRGIALILVLWIIVLLTMSALSLSLLTRTDALATLSVKHELENKFLAEAGIRRGIMELFYRNANRNQQMLLEGFEPFQCDGRDYAAEMADGHYRIWITEESGKINLNTLTDHNGVVLKNLLMNSGVAEERANTIIDSILDWKDRDNIHRLNGAEDDYYQSLPKPYKAKNADFDSLEELIFVQGISGPILHGSEGKKGILPSAPFTERPTRSICSRRPWKSSGPYRA